jgi:hypothetical protein
MQDEIGICAKATANHQEKLVIETNLYNLVETVSDEVPNGDDRMVSIIVTDILKQTGVTHLGV